MSRIDRTPPTPESWNAPWGTCRWCGEKIFKADGATINDRRRWHDDCQGEYNFARNPSGSAFLMHRAKDRCQCCNKMLLRCYPEGPVVDPSTLPMYPKTLNRREPLAYNDLSRFVPKDPDGRRRGFIERFGFMNIFGGQFTAVHRDYGVQFWSKLSPVAEGWSGWFTRVMFDHEPWHADHVIPLWLVDRTLPWAKLIRYWLEDNLQVLCEKCHKVKTAEEAGQRAKIKRNQTKHTSTKYRRGEVAA